MLESYIRKLQQAACFLGLIIVAQFAGAQEQTPNPEKAAIWKAANDAMVHGPQAVKLRDQAVFNLPSDYGFVPHDQAAKLMEAMGNSVDDRFIGLVFPLHDPDKNWFVTVDYEASGYIKDDDAKKWDADELLKNLKEGTEAGNKRREQLGMPPVQVTRWVESPKYQAELHQLVWSAEARLKNVDDPDPTINYNTYVLGRDGYISMDLITNASTVETDKSSAKQLLAAINFNSGKRYTDFNSSTDKVAEYGLAALVGGLAIKKLGLLAVIAAFFAKFIKVILVAVAAATGGFSKYFKRKPKEAPVAQLENKSVTPNPSDPVNKSESSNT